MGFSELEQIGGKRVPSGPGATGTGTQCVPAGKLIMASVGQPMFERITFDPNVMGGRACIRGMRITVSLVVSLFANGMSADEILREYPDLEPEDIREALAYASA